MLLLLLLLLIPQVCRIANELHDLLLHLRAAERICAQHGCRTIATASSKIVASSLVRSHMGCAKPKPADELPAESPTGAGRPTSAQPQAEKTTTPVAAQTVPTATSVRNLETKMREAEATIRDREAEQRVLQAEAAVRLEEAEMKARTAEQTLALHASHAALEKALRDATPGFFGSWTNHDSTAALKVAIAQAGAAAPPEGSSLLAALLAAIESLRSQREAKAKKEAEERARKEAVERAAEEKARKEAAKKARRELDEKFWNAAHHNPHHVVETEPWRSAVQNEWYKSRSRPRRAQWNKVLSLSLRPFTRRVRNWYQWRHWVPPDTAEAAAAVLEPSSCHLGITALDGRVLHPPSLPAVESHMLRRPPPPIELHTAVSELHDAVSEGSGSTPTKEQPKAQSRYDSRRDSAPYLACIPQRAVEIKRSSKVRVQQERHFNSVGPQHPYLLRRVVQLLVIFLIIGADFALWNHLLGAHIWELHRSQTYMAFLTVRAHLVLRTYSYLATILRFYGTRLQNGEGLKARTALYAAFVSHYKADLLGVYRAQRGAS